MSDSQSRHSCAKRLVAPVGFLPCSLLAVRDEGAPAGAITGWITGDLSGSFRKSPAMCLPQL